uniref:Uncharacterized protein n=1 Tax=Brassica oleracea var. oleracea TaxID=109376 RepID=A0A0D2ZSU2_BRAOL
MTIRRLRPTCPVGSKEEGTFGRFGSSHPVGLGRRTRSVPPSSAPPPFVDQEVFQKYLRLS